MKRFGIDGSNKTPKDLGTFIKPNRHKCTIRLLLPCPFPSRAFSLKPVQWICFKHSVLQSSGVLFKLSHRSHRTRVHTKEMRIFKSPCTSYASSLPSLGKPACFSAPYWLNDGKVVETYLLSLGSLSLEIGCSHSYGSFISSIPPPPKG